MRKSIGDGICVESSLVLRALTGEPGAEDLFGLWKAKGKELVAPALLEYEVIAWAEGQEEIRWAMAKYHELEIELFHGRAISERALGLIPGLRWREAVYLATAQVLACDVWTADPAFADKVKEIWPWVFLYQGYATDS